MGSPGSPERAGADGEAEGPSDSRSLAELRFAVVGTYVADCFVNTARLPAWGHEYEARSIRTTPGGKALNQAVALARLGAQVAAVGVVGRGSAKSRRSAGWLGSATRRDE
jgi:bifunctional ADP-heptose synthase (sugar kinase/adenylyltransferase)